MAKNPLQEAIQQLKRNVEAVNKNSEAIIVDAVNTVHAAYDERIFVLGKATNGERSEYSKEPMYAPVPYKRGLVKNSLLVKVGKTRSDGIARPTKRTMYLSGGYRQLRGLLGLQVKFANFNLTGSLRFSIKVKIYGNRAILAIIGEKHTAISYGLEKRFDKMIFAVSKAENNIFLERVEFLIRKKIQQ